MNIVEVLLKELRVRYSKNFIKENYLNAPDSDNMLGIQRVLSQYNIETVGVHFQDKEKAEFTFPCVIHLNNLIVVGVDCNEESINFFNGKDYITEDIPTFNRRWTGDVLFITNTTNAREPSYINNKFIDIYKGGIYYFLLALVACVGFSCFAHYSIVNPVSINMIFDLIGFFICILLFQKQFHEQSTIADRICTLLQKNGCDSVLESESSKFLGVISWTEIGLAYFSSRILFSGLYENHLMTIQLIGWIAMPYGLWSIWSQAFKIKHWCTLCCITQIIIWTSGIYNIFVFGLFKISITDFTLYSICYITTFAFIQHISFLHSVNEKYYMVNKNFLSFKMNNSIFETALLESTNIEVNVDDSSIVYGKKSAFLTLTVLTNPHCAPCAKMHKRLMNLINESPNINIQYIYSSFNDDVESSSLFCIAIYQQKSHEEAVKILEEWFLHGRYHRDTFIRSYNVDIYHPDVIKEYAKHKLWRERTGIEATPTIIYNGHSLPNFYEVEDFLYIDKGN